MAINAYGNFHSDIQQRYQEIGVLASMLPKNMVSYEHSPESGEFTVTYETPQSAHLEEVGRVHIGKELKGRMFADRFEILTGVEGEAKLGPFSKRFSTQISITAKDGTAATSSKVYEMVGKCSIFPAVVIEKGELDLVSMFMQLKWQA